jgi:hypothetical protein
VAQQGQEGVSSWGRRTEERLGKDGGEVGRDKAERWREKVESGEMRGDVINSVRFG